MVGLTGLRLGVTLLMLCCFRASVSECAMFFDGQEPAGESESEESQRLAMVSVQLEGRGIRDKRVLDAMRKVPRHEFVPERIRREAYDDGPLPIGHHQTISQPYVVAFMTEALRPGPGDRVLEIGTGSGYQAAILAEIVKEVYTVEIVEPLALQAQETLSRLGYRNVRFRVGDGWMGWPEEAPFDKITVTAAPEEIPQALIDQLAEGGILVIPVGAQGYQTLIVGVKKNGHLEKTEAMGVRFVPLVRGRS